MNEPAQSLGRYRILGELGRGSMGVVYRADDPMLNRTVAIKTINMVADAEDRAEYEKRFYQEAKAAGGLSHPNVVTIYDIGHAGDVVYMAMEYIEGTELRDLLLRGRLDAATAVDIAAQVAEGLAYAHMRGVVHRDVKPANIMVPRDGPAKIMDFGIARMRASEVKTQTGMLLGSPKYMSPEQLLGGAVDQRCDIFSLGVVLYEALTGAPPFSGSDITQIMYQIVNAAPPPPSAVNSRVSPMLDLIVAKALAKDPAARYPDARELAADLRACRAAVAALAPAADEDETLTLPLGRIAPQAADASQTLRIDPAPAHARRTAAPSTTAPPRVEAGLRLRISRRFDSLEATRRLAAMTGAGAAVDAFAKTMKLDLAAAIGGGRTSPPPPSIERASAPARAATRSHDRWILAASVTIAALVALAIALV
jgi:serine/threonine-protein kinase